MMPSNFERIRNKWEGKTNNTNPPINNSNTQSTTASIHNGNSSIDINNNNNNLVHNAVEGASANSVPPPSYHINPAAVPDNGQEGILIDAIAKDRNEEIKAEQYFRIKEENARRTNMSRDDYIGLTQFSQPFSNSTWDVEGEGRSRGSRRSGSRAAQSISNSNVYHPTRTASSPQRPPPVRPNNAHSPPKGTPGRSKAIRHNEGSSFTSTSSTNNYNPPAVYGHPGGYQQQQHHQSIHPSMPWCHPSYPPIYGHHHMPPHPPTHYPNPSMQMNYNYAQPSGIHPHPSQHPLPTHPPLSHHPHQQQHSSRHPAPIHYPANHSRPTQNNARVSNTTNTSASINNGISLDSSNGNTNRSATLSTHHQTRGTCRNRLTSDQIRSELPQSVEVMNGDFVLRDWKAVFGGNDTGYLRPFNAAEEDALYNSINGMVTTHIPICGSKPRFLKPGQKPDRKRSSRSFGSDKFIFENLVTLYCRHGGWKGGCGVEKLSGMFRTLTIGERKQLKADLVKRRLSNTVEMKPWECVATYLLRRAHRNADSDALEIMTTLKHEKAAEKKSAQKKKGKKKPAAKSYDEVRAEQLVLDKDAGETCDDDAAIGKPPTTANPQYQSEFMQIDGEGGALQAALEDTSDDVDDYYDDLCEKRSDRVVMKRELGDFNQVKYDAATGIICCDCETFNRLGDCPHRVYVEVLHLKEYPDGNANEQWQVMREKMISNLSTQCGALLED